MHVFMPSPLSPSEQPLLRRAARILARGPIMQLRHLLTRLLPPPAGELPPVALSHVGLEAQEHEPAPSVLFLEVPESPRQTLHAHGAHVPRVSGLAGPA